MKLYIPILTGMMLLIAALISCNLVNKSQPQLSTRYFPNSVGDSWTYAVSDSSGQVIDTLQVTIQRETKLSDGTKANVWQYISHDTSFSRYVVQSADSVFMYADSTKITAPATFIIPYKIGKSWLSIWRYDIDRKDTINLTNGAKITAYHLKIGPPNPNSADLNPPPTEMWLAPYIGIVKEKGYVNISTANSDLYQLLNYHLK